MDQMVWHLSTVGGRRFCRPNVHFPIDRHGIERNNLGIQPLGQFDSNPRLATRSRPSQIPAMQRVSSRFQIRWGRERVHTIHRTTTKFKTISECRFNHSPTIVEGSNSWQPPADKDVPIRYTSSTNKNRFLRKRFTRQQASSASICRHSACWHSVCWFSWRLQIQIRTVTHDRSNTNE